MRHWQLDYRQPLSLQLAADARLSQTDYIDDQSWQVRLGSGDESAMTLQTQYGGRVGLASIVPMWEHDNRVLYQVLAYQSPPIVTAFAPGYLQIKASLLPDVTVTAAYWVGDSHSITGQFVVENQGITDISLRFDLYAHVIIRSTEQQIGILTLQDQTNALYLGKYAGVDPVVMVADGTMNTSGGNVSAKVGRSLTVPAGASEKVRWAHAALTDMENSVRHARYWLKVDWDEINQNVEQAASAIPQIETGHKDWDATIAFSYQQAVQSLLRPTESLPNASFVSAREPINGYSRSGDGSDYIREWSGQNPTTAYLLTQALAPIAPNIAEGLIRNYIATQQDSGSIDWAPGLGSQRRDMLAIPILAHMAWQTYQITQNKTFINDVFTGLLKFFEYWFTQDADEDGVPEWQDITQTGYAGWSLFNGGVHISLTETPDMLAYLLREATALQAMADELGHESDETKKLASRLVELQSALDDFWHDGQFAYRDRDTHTTPTGIVVLEKGKADDEHILALPLDENSRLVIDVVGGASHTPRMSVTIQGLNADGTEITETLNSDRFVWSYGRGTATTQTVFSQVDLITDEGLSRVYRISVRSVDLNDIDMNTILPLWTQMLTQEQAQAVVDSAWDKLLRPNGLALFQRSDAPGADPSGVWVFWNALIGEGLLHYDYHEQAVDLLKRLLRVQATTLREIGKFTPFYHEEDTLGIGTRMDISGMVPLHVLMQAFGVTIHPDGSVTISESFAWGEPITITQHGITIKRDSNETHITYPDGETYTVATGQAETVVPSQPVEKVQPPLQLPEKPQVIQQDQTSIPVRIEVEIEDDNAT